VTVSASELDIPAAAAVKSLRFQGKKKGKKIYSIIRKRNSEALRLGGIFVFGDQEPRQLLRRSITWLAWGLFISLCRIPLQLKNNFRKSLGSKPKRKKYADADTSLGIRSLCNEGEDKSPRGEKSFLLRPGAGRRFFIPGAGATKICAGRTGTDRGGPRATWHWRALARAGRGKTRGQPNPSFIACLAIIHLPSENNYFPRCLRTFFLFGCLTSNSIPDQPAGAAGKRTSPARQRRSNY